MQNEWLKQADLKEENALLRAKLEEATLKIQEATLKIQNMNAQVEEQLEAGFQEAWEEIQKQKDKNDTLEVQMYEEFERKRKEERTLLVKQIDAFLNEKWLEIQKAEKEGRAAELLKQWREAVPAQYMMELATDS